MTQPQAGWYPDPSGDTTKLRYWDGAQWTESFMDNPQAAPAQAQAQPVYSQQTVYVQPGPSEAVFAVSKEDQTLRLIAFIFCLISTISVCWALIPLAWMIPMTVMSWGIYKGKRANTTAFGVCTLIFVSLVAGILLLVSTKDE